MKIIDVVNIFCRFHYIVYTRKYFERYNEYFMQTISFQYEYFTNFFQPATRYNVFNLVKSMTLENKLKYVLKLLKLC